MNVNISIQNKRKITFLLLLSAAFFAAFALLIVLLCTVDRAPVGAGGEVVGLSRINTAVRDALGYHPFFLGVTDASGILLLAEGLFFAFMGFRSLWKKKKFVLVEREFYLLAALYLVMAAAYFLFRAFPVNTRPILLDGETPAPSFPSSHVLLAVTIGASAIPILRMIFADRPKCLLAGTTVSFTLLLVTVLGRTLSGVHWITDIIGGLLLGWALVTLFLAVVLLTCTRAEKSA